MNRKLLIIKCNPISFLLNRPKRHKRAAFHTFLCFLPMLKLRHPRRVSLIERGRTQVTPKIANNNSHKTLALVQWIRIWSIDSSYSQQRKHLLARIRPLFFCLCLLAPLVYPLYAFGLASRCPFSNIFLSVCLPIKKKKC